MEYSTLRENRFAVALSPKTPSTAVGLRVKIIGLLSGVLFVLLVLDIAWTYQVQRDNTESMLLEESRVLVTEMDAVWTFMSVNQDTINYTSDNVYEYKGLHCAIAGKSVAVLFSRNSDYTIRFANFEPRNPRNTPDDYETEALRTFLASNDDITEFYGFTENEGESVFRYVSAMEVSENCIECHGDPAGEIDITGFEKEGWKVGDLAGAVSVIVPTGAYFANMYESVLNNVLFFLAIILAMALVIYFALSRLITSPLTTLRGSFEQMGGGSFSALENSHTLYASREIDEVFEQFNTMASKLSDLYASMESRVSERTMQLSEANEELERQKLHVEEVNSKLKQENQYKSDFLAIISHELRSPLTSILAFTELMEQNISTDDTLVRKQLEEIDTNGQILLEMVNNVLETARIQAGSEQLNLELVDLNDIVGMLESTLEGLAFKNGITLTTYVDPAVPLITSDWEKVRRILSNLLSNALKFTGPGGAVHLNARYDESLRIVFIDVTDTGIGIPQDKHELIFERFVQENMSTVRRYGGSGLGLSLVKELVTMLQGDISVVSEPGKGSTFSVALPSDLKIGVEDDKDHADR
jgi:signal transduction histidine kinase